MATRLPQPPRPKSPRVSRRKTDENQTVGHAKSSKSRRNTISTDVNKTSMEATNETIDSAPVERLEQVTESTSNKTPTQTTELTLKKTPIQTTEPTLKKTPIQTTEPTLKKTPVETTETTPEKTLTQATDKVSEQKPKESVVKATDKKPKETTPRPQINTKVSDIEAFMNSLTDDQLVSLGLKKAKGAKAPKTAETGRRTIYLPPKLNSRLNAYLQSPKCGRRYPKDAISTIASEAIEKYLKVLEKEPLEKWFSESEVSLLKRLLGQD